LKVTRGWDDVTGIGSPNARWITSVSRREVSGHARYVVPGRVGLRAGAPRVVFGVAPRRGDWLL